MSKMSGRSMAKRQNSDLSLGAIDEDSVFGSFGDGDDVPSPSNKFTRSELFDNDMSIVGSVTSPGGGSAFVDLEAEERAFVSGSQQYLDAMETIKQLKQRLIRRTAIIDEIRKYYLRDVITIKHIMKDVLTTRERQQVLKMYDENLPSLDLKQALVLHAPTKCELQVSHCGECGGQLEIIMKDSDEVDMLKKTIVDCKDRESRFRIKLATLDAQIENTTREKAEANKSHSEEKKFLYSEMKRIKAEVEKVQSELSKVNKANKRSQGENDILQSKLNALGQASRQLEAGSQEIEMLRTELSEATVALKTVRQTEKLAQRDLAERTVELKEVSLKAEEQSEALKYLRIERDEQAAEISTLKEATTDWIMKFTETSELHKAAQERVADLEAVVEEQTVEHDRLVALLNTSEDDLKLELVELEEECTTLKVDNKSLTKEKDKLKRSLEKSQEHNLVLEHDLAVATHEIKQREEELHSLQNYIHDKMGKQQAASSSQTDGGVPMRMEDVLHSIKAEARSRAGDGPGMSAKVASVKLMRQQEMEAIAEAAAAAVLAAESGSAPPSAQGKRRRSIGGVVSEDAENSDDDIGNFDKDTEHDDHGEHSETAERKAHKKKGNLRKARNVLRASVSSATGEQKAARRKSMQASPAVTPAKAPQITPKKTKRAKKMRSDGDEGGEEEHHSGDEQHDEAADGAEEEGEHHEDDHPDEGAETNDAAGEATDATTETASTTTATKKKKAADKPKAGTKDKDKESKEKVPKKSKSKDKDEDAGTTKPKKTTKGKRRRSFGGGDGPPRPGTGNTDQDAAADSLPGSNPSSVPSSRGNSRPSTRGSVIDSARRRQSRDGEESGLDDAAETSDGERDRDEERAAGIAKADSFDENEETEAAEQQNRGDRSGRSDRGDKSARSGERSARSVRSARSERSDGHAETPVDEHDEDHHGEEQHELEGVPADGGGDATDDGAAAAAAEDETAEAEDTVGFEGESEAPVKSQKAAAKSTKKAPSVSAKKVTAPAKKAPAKSAAAAASAIEEAETDGEARSGSREGGRRSRNAPAKKKYTNSKEIKKEAMEASGSVKQTRVKAQTLELNKEPRAPRKARKPKLQTRREPGEAEATEVDEPVEDEGAEEGEQDELDAEDDQFEEQEETEDVVEEEEEEEAQDSEAEEEQSEEEEAEVVQVVAKQAAPVREVKKVAAITVVKKKAAEPKPKRAPKVKVHEAEDLVSPLASPDRHGAASPSSVESHPPPVIPLPKRRRSIPKSYSFSRHSMAELLGDGHSLHSAASNDSLDSLTLAHAVAHTVSKVAPADEKPHSASPTVAPISEERKLQLEAEFAEGAHRVPDPPSINDDDDLRDRAHVMKSVVPVIPIEVKRYIGNTKNKMPIIVDEVVALEPLAPGATPFEVKLRADLLKAMKIYPGVKESDAHKAINATNKTMHQFCNLYSKTIDSTWTALKANRGALDLHYTMKTVIEGMAACTEVKSGSVELADVCKRILPIAGLSPLGSAVTLKWQEEVKLHETVLTSLLPTVDAATGKISAKEASDFFNTNLLDPTAKVAGALNILIDKVNLAQHSADQMQHYAADASKAVSDKLVVVLRDWAKVKNAFYEMDSKIAAEKEKVRKVLEIRIADLTKEKAQLGVVCNKHEERIRVLEGVEKLLETANFNLKKSTVDVHSRDEIIEGLENDVLALQDEIAVNKAREGKKDDYIGTLQEQKAGLEGTMEELRKDIAQRLADLSQSKVELSEVSEERDHFQAQYERMVQQEYSRLHKLVTTQMQCEPAVQDLAIQTEFVAPPMNLRTMVASKNTRGKKAPLILSQSLEVPPSDPGILTSSMLDTASSTFHPLSQGNNTVLIAHGSTHSSTQLSTHMGGPGSAGSSFPMIMTPPSMQPAYNRASSIGDRMITSAEASTGTQQAHVLSSRENSAASGMNLRTLSREESFFMNASDFLAAAPINYELSSRSRAQADGIQEISRLLANDDNASVGSTSTRGHGGGHFTKKKAVKLSRIPHVEPSSGHYQHVHNEDKVPQWGTVHSKVPTSTVNINPGVVLGISGVGSIGGHTNKLSAFSNREGHGGGTSTLSAAGSALLRTSVNGSGSNRSKGIEIEVGLPEVKIQSFNMPSAQRTQGHQSLAQQITNSINDAAYLRSSNNSRGSVGTNGLGLSTSDKSLSPDPHLMLDSPTLGGSSKQMPYDFDRDRKQLLRIAGELPPGQEVVDGIIYNHRGAAGVTFRSDEQAGYDSPDAHSRQPYKPDHSTGSSMMHSASQGSVAQSQAGKLHTSKPGLKVSGGSGSLQQDSAHSAVSGVLSEDILKRLRKELLSR